MIKAKAQNLIFYLSFLLISGIMFYCSFAVDEKALTSNGYSAKIFYFAMGTVFLIIPCLILIWVLIKKKRIDELMAVGKKGTAKVLKLEDTGTRINNNPRVKLLLEIFVPDYPAYRAQKTVALPLINISQVQPESIIQVLAVPQQTQN